MNINNIFSVAQHYICSVFSGARRPMGHPHGQGLMNGKASTGTVHNMVSLFLVTELTTRGQFGSFRTALAKINLMY